MNFVFFILLLFSSLYSEFIYHNIIQLTVNSDPKQIKNDLDIINEYKKNKINEVYLYKDGTSNVLPFYAEIDNQIDNGVAHFDLYRVIAKQLLEVNHNGIENICFYYRGFYKYSDELGRVVFPRLDLFDSFSIIITRDVVPIIFTGSIPDHFIVGYESPYACYQARASYFQDDKENQKMAWKVYPSESILDRDQIPYNAIIIFGDPLSFLFSDNELVMQSSLNVLLPTLFVDSYLNHSNDVFSHYGQLAINTLRYWEPLEFNIGETEFDDQIHSASVLV